MRAGGPKVDFMNPELIGFLVVLAVLVSLVMGTVLLFVRRRLNPLAVDRTIGWPPYVERDRFGPFRGWAVSVLVVFLAVSILTAFVWYMTTPTW